MNNMVIFARGQSTGTRQKNNPQQVYLAEGCFSTNT